MTTTTTTTTITVPTSCATLCTRLAELTQRIDDEFAQVSNGAAIRRGWPRYWPLRRRIRPKCRR